MEERAITYENYIIFKNMKQHLRSLKHNSILEFLNNFFLFFYFIIKLSFYLCYKVFHNLIVVSFTILFFLHHLKLYTY